MTTRPEAINIISTAPGAAVSGGTKVFANLVKGLERVGYPFVVNHRLDATRRIWVHNEVFALPAVLRRKDAQPVLGPNLFVMPRDIPGLRFTGCLYLQPSDWAACLRLRSLPNPSVAGRCRH